MRIRRILAAVMATAAFAGLGLTGVATATAATAQGAPSVVTPSECKQGGGTPAINEDGNYCKGGTHNGEQVD
uniref:Chaplin domain-containing protein n=1 Tax=Streptomyces sp. NBC_00049 TaxID=2903617 RepID=A0AAU2JK98_9ACTN